MTESNNKPKASRTPGKRRLATLPAPLNKSRHLEVFVKPGETQDRVVAGRVARGLVTNASTAIRFLQAEHDDLSLMDIAHELREQGEAVNRGDLSGAERMLNAQAVALNAIFAEMARRAALNMSEHLSATEIYMRLALKAQSQSRATFETLAAIKNPPVVFARQANINNGGQQHRFPARERLTFQAERTFRGLDAWLHATGRPSNGRSRPNKSRLGARGHSQPAREAPKVKRGPRATPGRGDIEPCFARLCGNCRRVSGR